LKLEDLHFEGKEIDNTIYHDFRNDICKMVNGKLFVLIEHQSTINFNMPLRLLSYVSRLYEAYVPTPKRYYKNAVQIPTPEFYVIYNGTENFPAVSTMRLSDSFLHKKEEKTLEIIVKVFNIIKYKEISGFLDCKPIQEYNRFVEIMRAHYDPKNPETFTPAIQLAIKENVMPNYLNRKTTEVSNMLWGEYNYDEDIAAQRQEAFDDGLSKGVSQGIQQGISQGIQQKAIETAKNFLSMGLQIEQIAKGTGLSLATIQQLAKDFPQ
jgi:predicted transposase/invertase (TIGR01784 family)